MIISIIKIYNNMQHQTKRQIYNPGSYMGKHFSVSDGCLQNNEFTSVKVTWEICSLRVS
jgi:hypothetical protein